MQKVKITLSRKHQCERNKFINKLFDYELMKTYQVPPLVSYDLNGNKLQKGTIVNFYYDVNKTKVIKEEVISNNLPNEIIFKQTFNNIILNIKHTFKEKLWCLEYEFIINKSGNVDKLGLAKQLEEDMESFIRIL